MVWGTFFGDEVPQSARLSAGGGVQKLTGNAQMPPATLILGPLQMCRFGNKERLNFGDLLRVFL